MLTTEINGAIVSIVQADFSNQTGTRYPSQIPVNAKYLFFKLEKWFKRSLINISKYKTGTAITVPHFCSQLVIFGEKCYFAEPFGEFVAKYLAKMVEGDDILLILEDDGEFVIDFKKLVFNDKYVKEVPDFLPQEDTMIFEITPNNDVKTFVARSFTDDFIFVAMMKNFSKQFRILDKTNHVGSNIVFKLLDKHFDLCVPSKKYYGPIDGFVAEKSTSYNTSDEGKKLWSEFVQEETKKELRKKESGKSIFTKGSPEPKELAKNDIQIPLTSLNKKLVTLTKGTIYDLYIDVFANHIKYKYGFALRDESDKIRIMLYTEKEENESDINIAKLAYKRILGNIDFVDIKFTDDCEEN